MRKKSPMGGRRASDINSDGELSKLDEVKLTKNNTAQVAETK